MAFAYNSPGLQYGYTSALNKRSIIVPFGPFHGIRKVARARSSELNEPVRRLTIKSRSKKAKQFDERVRYQRVADQGKYSFNKFQYSILDYLRLRTAIIAP